jgi:hypothetical protein
MENLSKILLLEYVCQLRKILKGTRIVPFVYRNLPIDIRNKRNSLISKTCVVIPIKPEDYLLILKSSKILTSPTDKLCDQAFYADMCSGPMAILIKSKRSYIIRFQFIKNPSSYNKSQMLNCAMGQPLLEAKFFVGSRLISPHRWYWYNVESREWFAKKQCKRSKLTEFKLTIGSGIKDIEYSARTLAKLVNHMNNNDVKLDSHLTYYHGDHPYILTEETINDFRD